MVTACAQAVVPEEHTVPETTTPPETETVVAVQEAPNVNTAPDFSVETIDGKTVSLQKSIEEGKPTVVYFMASWCPTCAKNWAALNEVYPTYADEVNFVAVSIDPTDTKEVLVDLAQEKGFVFDSSPGNVQLAIDYDVKKQTAKFAIDKEGNIVSRHDGALNAEEWTALFESVLN